MKAIFDTRAESGYDDYIVRQYHFPNRYLAIAETTVGDWIIYREPTRGGGRKGYVAVARVILVEPDSAKPGYSYAFVADFLPFDGVVPLRRGPSFYEAMLDRVENPSRIGAALQGKSIRNIPEPEFGAIVRVGLRQTLDPKNAIWLELDSLHADADASALVNAPPKEQERRITQMLMNRKIRDAGSGEPFAIRTTIAAPWPAFVSSMAEVQAAHIWPVADGGPDVVQNGIALSATAHWLFDRHLISLTDDRGLLVSHNRVPSELRSLFAGQLESIHLPSNPNPWPQPAYIRRHREAFAAA